jgi:hypothetical protein
MNYLNDNMNNNINIKILSLINIVSYILSVYTQYVYITIQT